MRIAYASFYVKKNVKSDCGQPPQKTQYHEIYSSKKAELEEYKELIRKLGYGF